MKAFPGETPVRACGKIPVSAVIVTRNEEARIGPCLAALSDFDEIVVVDSHSADATADIARRHGALVVPFSWNGAYPKKRQWCLETLSLRHDFVFFVDADEIVTPALAAEIRRVFARRGDSDGFPAGFFVRGRYRMGGRILRHGLSNNKLCLIDRRQFFFPEVADLHLPGMGEIEGHYQPRRRKGTADRGRSRGGEDRIAHIARLRAYLIHDALGDFTGWEARHRRYAAWEAGMTRGNLWPADPLFAREALKKIFRRLPFRPLAAFLHSYVLKRGFLDGRAGWRLAALRARYYRMIAAEMRAPQGGRNGAD